MALMDRIKTHFRGLVPRVIEVPEWGEGGLPLVIYGRAPSVGDAVAIMRAGRESSTDAILEAIKRLACDEDNKKLFTPGDIIDLKHTASKEVVERVGYALLRDRDGNELMAPIEEAAATKNFEASR